MGAVDLQLYTLMNNDSLDFIFRPSGDITQEVTVARMESLRKAASRAQPPDRVIGGKIRTTPDGWTLEIDRRAIKTTHPWKVTANGDNTVTVAAGKVLSFENEAVATAGNYPTYIHLKEFFNYDGTEDEPITVTGTGKIYAEMGFVEGNPISIFDLDPGSLEEDGISSALIPNVSSTITVTFDSTLPTSGDIEESDGIMVFEIANVSLDDNGKAVVDDQILTHNPPMWLIDIPLSIL